MRSVLGSWVKPYGTRLEIRKGEKGAVRLPKILVLTWRLPVAGERGADGEHAGRGRRAAAARPLGAADGLRDHG